MLAQPWKIYVGVNIGKQIALARSLNSNVQVANTITSAKNKQLCIVVDANLT